MKKLLLHLFWLFNAQAELKKTTLPRNVKGDIYNCFTQCVKLIKVGSTAEVTGNINHHKFVSPNPILLQLLLREIMINEQYYVDIKNDAPYIIDCGSNIGLSILYFKLKFPNAKIVGIEANPDTFKVLSENVKHLKDVTVLCGYVSNTDDQEVELYSTGAGDVTASFHSGRGGETHITTNTISLKKLVGDRKVDILKIDIEGGEFALFNSAEDAAYLKNVDNILLEYHHLIDNKNSNSLADFLKVFEKNNFAYNINALSERESTPHFQDLFIKMVKLS